MILSVYAFIFQNDPIFTADQNVPLKRSLCYPLHVEGPTVSVQVEDRKCQNRFLAVTAPHVVQFTSGTDHTIPVLWVVMHVVPCSAYFLGVSHSLQCAWPVWPLGSRGLDSTPGFGGLLVHAGQPSAYSEINVSGRHRGSACVVLNL